MGTLTYDGTHIQFDDRVLAHLQVVIVQKFLKNQSFLMSWKESIDSGDGRASIWLAPTVPLHFKFLGGHSPAIDRDWLLVLGKSADSSSGLIVTDLDGELIHANAGGRRLPGTL